MKRFWMIVAMVVLLLGLFTVSASSESGTFDGISWDLTDGVLTLGEEGETQTLEDKSRNAHSWPWRDSESSITSVVTKGNLILKGSLNGIFDGRKDIVSIDVTGWNTSAVTNMSYMFYNCSGLTSLDLSSFDSSAVINMNAMFYGCWGLTNINLSGWDVHNVGIMQSMFYGCARLEQLDLSAWDVSSLRTAKEMFAKCTSLASINLSGWAPQPSSGCGMSSMFDGCTQLSTVTMTNCDTSHVIDFSRFFVGCTSLTEFNAASMDTSSATSLKSMFHSCSKFTPADQNWK